MADNDTGAEAAEVDPATAETQRDTEGEAAMAAAEADGEGGDLPDDESVGSGWKRAADDDAAGAAKRSASRGVPAPRKRAPAAAPTPPRRPRPNHAGGSGPATGWDRPDDGARQLALNSQAAQRAQRAAQSVPGGSGARDARQSRLMRVRNAADGGPGGFIRRPAASRAMAADGPAAAERARRTHGNVQAAAAPAPPAPQPRADHAGAVRARRQPNVANLAVGPAPNAPPRRAAAAARPAAPPAPGGEGEEEDYGSMESVGEDEQDLDGYEEPADDELEAILDPAQAAFPADPWLPKARAKPPSLPAWDISDSQVQQLGAAGGIAAIANRGNRTGHLMAPTPKELRGVPDKAVIALFGLTRSSLMRLTNNNDDALKAFSKTRTCALLMERDGYHVPEDFQKRPVFFHFQLDHFAMLRTAPIDLKKVEEWFYGFARWAIHDPNDDTRLADFAHIETTADDLLAALLRTEAVLVTSPGAAFKSTIRTAGDQLITHFSTFRTQHVRRVVDAARSFMPTKSLLPYFELIERAFVHLHAALPGLLSGVFAQIAAQGRVKGNADQQEEYVSRATIGVYRAFICGLSSSDFTPSVIKITAAPGAGSAAASVSTFPLPFSTMASVAPTVSVTTPAAVGFSPGSGSFATVSPLNGVANNNPSSGPLSLENMARQVAHGYRSAGAYVGPGGSNGGTEGIDLTPESRRVYFAHQILAGHRLPGQTIASAPAELPPIVPFQPIYVTAQVAQPNPVAVAPSAASSIGSVFSPGGSRTRPRPLMNSDELHIPYSIGLLGSFSPYRSIRPPETCYECGATNDHFAHECPTRFLRVRGELPPGWRREGPIVIRDTTKWIGQDLSEATRAEFRAFLLTHPLTPHPTFPVSVDEITGPQPAQARLPARRRP